MLEHRAFQNLHLYVSGNMSLLFGWHARTKSSVGSWNSTMWTVSRLVPQVRVCSSYANLGRGHPTGKATFARF